MKKVLFILTCLIFVGLTSHEMMAQKKPRKNKIIGIGNQYAEFETKAECANCEVLLQDKLLAIKGIKSVTLDLDSEVISVRYNGNQVDENEIKTAILAAGFSVDGEKGYKEPRKNLPDCCK